MRKLIRNNKILGAFLGTIVEYYDYSLYIFSAAIIGAQFFEESDPLSSLSKVFGIYAVSYLAKPLGSIIFSILGDYYGRKIALSITILGIAIPTCVIGLLPSYSEIGVWSTIILIICRFTQSLFVAGEYDGAAIYVIEHLGDKYHYTASAITRSSGVIGLLLGIGFANFFSSRIFPSWGWRIPFLLSFPLALIALHYRRKFEETPEFQLAKKLKAKTENFGNLIRTQGIKILMMIILAGGFGVTYQVAVIFMKQYLPLVIPQTHLFISTFSITLVACFGFCMPIAGILADRFGQVRIISLSLLSTVIFAVLLGIAIKHQMINLLLISAIGLSSSVAPFNALAHGIAVKTFPVDQRYRGIGIAHTLGSLLMSGSTNYVCLLFIKDFDLKLFPIFYVIFFSSISYGLIMILEKKYLRKALSSMPNQSVDL